MTPRRVLRGLILAMMLAGAQSGHRGRRDACEWDDDPDYRERFASHAYRLGINVVARRSQHLDQAQRFLWWYTYAEPGFRL